MNLNEPLTDLRIVAVEQFGAGPWATMQLADLGADVIKVEDPAVGGDVARYVPPMQQGEDSVYFEAFNRGKRSVSLNLRSADGRAALEDLVAESDAVLSNLRGGLAQKLGLTYDALKHRNPRIVCCALTGFGSTGPRGREGGYDPVAQAMAGWMHYTGDPDGPPTRSGLPLVDLSAGYVAAIALLAGVWRARRDGTGCDCDISLFETALAQLCYVGTWSASGDYQANRTKYSAHPSVVPFQAFQTSDGWITVACAKESLWRGLCQALDRPELAENPSYATFADRLGNRDELVALLMDIFGQRPTAEWIEILGRHGIPSGPVNDFEQAFADPQTAARELLVDVDHPTLGTCGTSPRRCGSATIRRRSTAAQPAANTRARSSATRAAIRLTASRRSSAPEASVSHERPRPLHPPPGGHRRRSRDVHARTRGRTPDPDSCPGVSGRHHRRLVADRHRPTRSAHRRP
jgi:crotonobetainyl-CoA:carnitine CoA-transferase CaiB-like acyl-CoA transferase